MRTCYVCKQEKPLEDFGKKARANNPEARAYVCKTCNYTQVTAWRKKNPEKHLAQVMRHREKYPDQQRARGRKWNHLHPEYVHANGLKQRYNLPLGEYQKILDAQNGTCAICKAPTPGHPRQTNFSVDHNHTTNQIRGLLCHSCNTGIGAFKDSIEILRAAIAYLQRFSTGP